MSPYVRRKKKVLVFQNLKKGISCFKRFITINKIQSKITNKQHMTATTVMQISIIRHGPCRACIGRYSVLHSGYTLMT